MRGIYIYHNSASLLDVVVKRKNIISNKINNEINEIIEIISKSLLEYHNITRDNNPELHWN